MYNVKAETVQNLTKSMIERFKKVIGYQEYVDI